MSISTTQKRSRNPNLEPVIEGERWGNLTALMRLNSGDWLWLCDCGQSVSAKPSHVRRKHGTSSCGCKKKSLNGLGTSPEWNVWHNVYADKWPDFLDFWTELGPRPDERFHVTAIDTQKPIGPRNAIWANSRVRFGQTEIASFEGLTEMISKDRAITALSIAAYEAKKDPSTFDYHLGRIEREHIPEDDLLNQQKIYEDESVESGKRQWLRQQESLTSKGRSSQSDVGKEFMRRLVPTLAWRLNENVEQAEKRLAAGSGSRHGTRYHTVIPKIRLWIDDHTIAYITLACTMDAVGRGATAKVPLATLYRNIGERLEHQMFLEIFKEADPETFAKAEKKFLKDSTRTYRRKVYAMEYLSKDSFEYEPLDQKELIVLGDWTTNCLQTVTKWFEATMFRPDANSPKTQQFLTLSKDGLAHRDLIEAAASVSQFTVNPMVCEPLDWTNDIRGGYLDSHPGGTSKLIHGNRGTELSDEALAAINHMQKVGWRVNRLIYEVQKELIATTNEIGAFKSYEKDSWMDEHMPVIDPRIWKSEDKDEQKKARRSLSTAHDSKVLAEKQRIIPQRILETAARFVNFERIYLPMFVDARGRMYYMCDTLSPQGSDYQKALLEFSDGTEVTEENFSQVERELLINLANTYDRKPDGYDRKTSKLTFNDRVEWARGFAAGLEFVVDDPMESEARKLWTSANEPFLFLATLVEYWNVCVAKTQKTAHAPLALDATNSGSQILGGVLRNDDLCHFCNVTPSEDGLPQDMYGEVARYAQARWNSIFKDEEFERINFNRMKENEKENSRLKSQGKEEKVCEIDYSSILKPEDITRSVAKRPSMCASYGASHKSKWKYVREELVEAGFTGKVDEMPRVGRVETLACTNAIIKGQDDAFPILEQINEFFQVVGKLCLALGKTFVEWKTPTGSLIRQEYLESVTVNVKCHAMGGGTFHTLKMDNLHGNQGEKTSMLKVETGYGDVIESKTASALAANWTHSIDATVAAIAVNDYSDSCGFIHDCLVAPPGKTFIFADAVRRSYHRCLTTDVFNDLAEANGLTLDQIYENIPEEKLFSFGNVNIDECLESPYLFS